MPTDNIFSLTPYSKRFKPKNLRQGDDTSYYEQKDYDLSQAEGATPTAENTYGGGGQLPTPTSVPTLRAQNEKVQKEQKDAVTNYTSNAPYNGLDYASQYLNNDGKGMTADELKASPVVNQDNAIVQHEENPDKRTDEQKDEVSNAEFLRQQGLNADYDEYMKNAPEYVSEEEQARRLRSSMSAKTVADLGSLASAFANLYTTNSGGYNQQVAYAKAPDYNAYINQWTKQRDAYKTYAQKGRDYVYQKQMQKAQNDYNRELQKLNLEYKQAQIDFQKANSNSKLIGDAIKQEQLELAQQKALNDYNYKLQTLNQRQAYNNAQIGLGYQRLAEDTRHHVQIEQKSSGKGSNKNWHIEGENGLSVDVPTANMNDYNRNQLLKLCGSDGTIGTGEKVYDVETKQMVEKTKPMTKEQKWTYIAEHMTPEAEDYIKRLGGQVSRREPIKEEEEPVPATPSYASPDFWGNNSGASQGGGMAYLPSMQEVSTTGSNKKSFGSNYQIKDTAKKEKSSGSNSKHKY